MRPLKLFILLLLVALLSACGTGKPPQVVDRTTPKTKSHGQHVVQRGETLYAIAWRYGRDFRKLASINGIKSPYVIKPLQVIYLSEASKPSPKVVAKPHKKALITSNNKSYKSTPKNAQIKRVSNWTWPAKGKIVGHYGGKLSKNKGLDITNTLGTPVLATAGGHVVYSGSGLRGYGKLIIIKHSDEYLSAYAHNKVLLVKEGDVVKEGQKIAEMGHSDANRVKLHFEIRKYGKPVNPLIYLARR